MVEFWSSVEYATFQLGLVRELEAAGWQARHRFQVPQAEYWNARSNLARWWLRTRSYALYPAHLAVSVARAPGGTIEVVSSNSFFAPLVAELATSRSPKPVVHWVFDLFPDVLLLAGKLRAGSPSEFLLRQVVRSTFHRAAANVFLGERLLAYAESKFGPIPDSVVIPVGCDARPFALCPPTSRERGVPVRALYCGNLGRMHDVATLAQALEAGMRKGIEFEFRGNGAGFRALADLVSEAQLGAKVRLGGNLPEDEWIGAMRAADLALVTMKPGAEGLVMPSKTYSALAAGQAVLAVCPVTSDLAATVRTHDCGWVIEPGDVDGLLRVFEDVVQNPSELFRRRSNAWRAGQEVYDQRVLAKSWMILLDSVIGRDNT